MVFSSVFVYIDPRVVDQNLYRSAPLPSREGKTVTASSLESAFTNRDACNSFRMCFYENCRVSLEQTSLFLKFHFNLVAHHPRLAPHSPLFSPFPFIRLRTLSFSVSRKFCVCHSYENSRVCTNNSHSGTEELGWTVGSLPLHQSLEAVSKLGASPEF